MQDRASLHALFDDRTGATGTGTAHNPATNRSFSPSASLLYRLPLVLKTYVSFESSLWDGTLTLKLDRMTSKPPSSGPSMFSAGTWTLSKVMYAVPAAVE